MGYSHTDLTSSCINLKWYVTFHYAWKISFGSYFYHITVKEDPKMDYFIIVQADVSGRICNRNMSSFSSTLLSVLIIFLRVGSHVFWLSDVKWTSVDIVSTKWIWAKWSGTVLKSALNLTIICGTPCICGRPSPVQKLIFHNFWPDQYMRQWMPTENIYLYCFQLLLHLHLVTLWFYLEN